MIGHYLLDGKRVVEVDTSKPDDLMKWALEFENLDRVVARNIVRGHLVSTVFLGLDHNLSGKGPPLVFETMVFAGTGRYEGYCDRHATYSQAVRRHNELVREIRGSLGLLAWIKNIVVNFFSGGKTWLTIEKRKSSK
jgi:hypothetical protein